MTSQREGGDTLAQDAEPFKEAPSAEFGYGGGITTQTLATAGETQAQTESLPKLASQGSKKKVDFVFTLDEGQQDTSTIFTAGGSQYDANAAVTKINRGEQTSAQATKITMNNILEFNGKQLTQNEYSLNLKRSAELHKKNLETMHAKSVQEMEKIGEVKGEFPASLHMYNLGIKDR